MANNEDVATLPVKQKKAKKPAYRSRATRAGDTASILSDVAETLRSAETYEDAQGALESLDIGEVESLSEEMTSWRDNIEEKFSATEKFERVSEAADTLEQVLDQLQSLGELTKPQLVAAVARVVGGESEVSQAQEEENPEWKDEAGTLADEIENAANDLENVEFPGMFN